MIKKPLVVALAVGLAASASSYETEPIAPDPQPTAIYAPYDSEPVIARIDTSEMLTVRAMKLVIRQLPAADLKLVSDVDPTVLQDNEIVVSPKDDQDCSLQISFSYDDAADLPEITTVLAAPSEVFGSDQDYTDALYGSDGYFHTEATTPSLKFANPERGIKNITSEIARLCPRVEDALASQEQQSTS